MAESSAQQAPLNPNTVLVVGTVAVAGIALIFLFPRALKLLDTVLETLGLADDDTDKAKEAAEASVNPALNTYNAMVWKPTQFAKTIMDKYPASKGYGYDMITAAQAKVLAKQVDDTERVFKDAPGQALTAIKACNTKLSVSRVAAAFADTFKRDMSVFLKEVLDTDDQQKIYVEIIGYVNSLPVGVTKKGSNVYII